MSPELIRGIVRAGPVGIFALVVWWELHELRTDLQRMGEGIAVLAERCQVADAR